MLGLTVFNQSNYMILSLSIAIYLEIVDRFKIRDGIKYKNKITILSLIFKPLIL